MFVTAQQLEQQMPDATRLLSDEPEMESSLHYMQLLLLVTSLEWLWRDQNDFFIGADLTIYPTFRTLNCHTTKNGRLGI